MTFKPIMPVPLTENWKVLTQPTIPVTFFTDIPQGRRFDNSDQPGGPGVIRRPDAWQVGFNPTIIYNAKAANGNL